MHDATRGTAAAMVDERLLDEYAAARWLGVAAATVRRWRWQGGGPDFCRVGRHVRYAPAALRAYIERRTYTSTSNATEPAR